MLRSDNQKRTLHGEVKAITQMVNVADAKSTELRDEVCNKTKAQLQETEKRDILRFGLIKSLKSEEIERTIKNLIVLRDNSVPAEAEFEEKINF